MGGGGGGAPHEVPDWKIYKAEGIPELDRLQRRLAAVGLKDPWIRNEVWRFGKGAGGTTSWQKTGLRMTFRGFGAAVVAMAVTIAVHKIVERKRGGQSHH